MTEILHELNLSQHIISPTRITNNSTTLIDHAISHIPENIDSACLVSDHHAIYLQNNWSQSLLKKQNVEVWDYQNGNYEALNARFRDPDWGKLLFDEDINTNYSQFTSEILKLARQVIPVEKIRLRPIDKPWYTQELRILKIKTLRIRKTAQKSNTDKA